MRLDEEVLKEEMTKLINERLGKYNILLHHIAGEDKETIARIIGEAFGLGFEYGIGKAKELYTES